MTSVRLATASFAGSKLCEKSMLRGRFRDDLRIVLVLIVEAVEHRELLLTVRGHVGWIDIERHRFRKLAAVMFPQSFNSSRDQHRLQLEEH